jgi:hypothetical protein
VGFEFTVWRRSFAVSYADSKFKIQNLTWITLGALQVSFAGKGYCEDQSQ